MNTTSILLIEDDFQDRQLIKKLLLPLGVQVFEGRNKSEALSLITTHNIELAILDIDLGPQEEEDGIALATCLQQAYPIPIIYLTAYETPQILRRAVATVPEAYLMKPLRTTELIAAVSLSLQKTSRKQEKQCILLKEEDYLVKIKVEEIDYIVSERNYLHLHCHNKVYRYRSTLKQILEILPTDKFKQTHRAYVINVDKINMLSRRSIVMMNQITIPVSKHYIEQVEQLYLSSAS